MAERFGLARWRLFGGLIPLEREMDRFLGHSLRWFDWPMYAWRHTPLLEREYFAPTELLERGGHTVVKMELPGVGMEDVDISIADGVLTVKGEKKHEEEVKEGDYYRSERTYGSFYRTLPVPEGIDTSKISATFDNGVLEVLLPKTGEKQEHKVPVKAKATTKTKTKKARAAKAEG